MRTFAISIFAAAAAFVLVAFLLSPTATYYAPNHQHLVADRARVDKKRAEPAPQALDIRPMPSEPTLPPTVAKPADMPSKPTADPTAPSPPKDEPASNSQDPKLTTGERLTLAQTSTSDTSLRNSDYPRTYISAIQVDLASPEHSVRLTWSGPKAASQETGPFHSSPGRGLGTNNCDDPEESNRQNSNCTPKGVFRVQGFSNTMPTYSHCKFVTWFLLTRGIAFHSYPDVADYPASHGCVRLDEHAAQLIHNNTKIGATEVTVGGHWTFGR